MQNAFQNMRPPGDTESREALRGKLAELEKECQELQADTRVIADEMDELTWVGDATGYHKALASLATFEKRLKENGMTVEPTR